MDPISPQGGVATILDLYRNDSVAEDVVALDHPLTVLVDKNPTSPEAIVNAVIAYAGIGSSMDRNTRPTLAGDVTFLQLKPTLGNIHSVPIAATRLLQRQVSYPTHHRPE